MLSKSNITGISKTYSNINNNDIISIKNLKYPSGWIVPMIYYEDKLSDSIWKL